MKLYKDGFTVLEAVGDDEEEDEEEERDAAVLPFGHYMKEAGVILISGVINDAVASRATGMIIEYNLMPKESRPEEISIIINSGGGSLSGTTQIIDMMAASEIPVSTIGYGIVASGALMILMNGHKGKRYLSHNAMVMSHQYSSGLSGKEYELINKYNGVKLTSKIVMNIYKKATGRSKKYIRKHLLNPADIYMAAETAIKHGLADNIVH